MRRLTIVSLAAALAGCGDGGMSSGTGSQNSPFVGHYAGGSTLVAGGPADIQTTREETIRLFVQADGSVLLGDGQTIFDNALLEGDSVTVRRNAALVLDDPGCTGTITLSAIFSSANGAARLNGAWFSDNLVCDGTPYTLNGGINAQRSDASTNPSSILQSVVHPAKRALNALRG